MFGRFRVTIIDRNEIAREGMRRILSDRGLGPVDTRSDASGVRCGAGHLVVVTCADAADALAACRIVRADRPDARIAVVVDDCCSDIVVDALAAGADGILSRGITVEPLVASLHLIALGEKLIPTSVVESMPSRSRATRLVLPERTDLSAREMAVLDRIAAGRANKLISRDLGIAEGTVKVHVKSILRKLGLANRTQAALWAAERGTATPAPPPSPIATVPAGGMIQ